MSPTSRQPGGPVLGVVGLAGLVAAVVAAYVVLWLVGQGPLGEVYTAAWVSRRLAWLFAPATLIVAIRSRRVLPAALSVLGLVVGVVTGELIGDRVFAVQAARLERDLAAGGSQSWEPGHPGWWIATLVFVAVTIAGAAVVERRGATGAAPPSGT